MSNSDSLRRAGGRLAGAMAALAVVLATGCTPPIKQFELRDQALSCEDANRLTYRTVEAMRFKVSDFQPAAAGQRGVIKAARTATDTGKAQSVTVTIDCTATGANIDAGEDGAWLNQMEFKRAFHHAFLNVVSMHAGREQLDQQILAGTAPASQQRRDLKIVVEPAAGQAAKLDFPFDLAASGVLPVRIAISNLTGHAYTLDPSAIRLARADGERIEALSPEDAAGRVATAFAAGKGAAATTAPSRQAIADTLTLHQFGATSIAPGTEREGFLYFPLAQYRSARVVVTDTETGEDEGVRVEF